MFSCQVNAACLLLKLTFDLASAATCNSCDPGMRAIPAQENCPAGPEVPVSNSRPHTPAGYFVVKNCSTEGGWFTGVSCSKCTNCSGRARVVDSWAAALLSCCLRVLTNRADRFFPQPPARRLRWNASGPSTRCAEPGPRPLLKVSSPASSRVSCHRSDSLDFTFLSPLSSTSVLSQSLSQKCGCLSLECKSSLCLLLLVSIWVCDVCMISLTLHETDHLAREAMHGPTRGLFDCLPRGRLVASQSVTRDRVLYSSALVTGGVASCEVDSDRCVCVCRLFWVLALVLLTVCLTLMVRRRYLRNSSPRGIPLRRGL